MAKIGNYLPLVLVVLIGLIFQGIFVGLDKTETPAKAATEFSKAYFLLNKDCMLEWLCEAQQSGDAVDDYIHRMTKTASARGFDMKFLKGRIFHIEIQTLKSDDNSATLRLTAKRRTSINPVFEYVGRLFSIGETTEVEKVIDLIKEKDQWKVCGNVFS